MKELIKIETSTCPNCKKLDKYLHSLDVEYKTMCIEPSSSEAKVLNITSVPTLLVIENNKVINRLDGLQIGKVPDFVKDFKRK